MSNNNQFYPCVDIRVKEGLLSSIETNISTGSALTSESMDSLSAIPTQSMVESNTGKGFVADNKQIKSDSMDVWPETNWSLNNYNSSSKPSVMDTNRYSDRQTNRQISCYFCGQLGHTKNRCPQLPPQTQPQRRDNNRFPNQKSHRKQGKDWNREEVIWATEGDRRPEKAVPIEPKSEPNEQKSGDNCWLFVRDYYLSDKLSDISFIVKGETLFAHRFVLGAKSDEFKRLLFDKTADKSPQMELNDTNVDAFKLVLKYLYCESLDDNDIDFNVLIEVMKLSKRYRLGTLSALIETQLISSLDVQNVIQVFNCSKEYALKGLMRITNDFIGNNALAIIEANILLKQSVNTITEFMTAFKSQKAIISAFKSFIESNEKLDLEPFKKLIQLNECSVEDIAVLKEIGLFDINLLFDVMIEKSKQNN